MYFLSIFIDIAGHSSDRELQLHYTTSRGFVSDSWAFLLEFLWLYVCQQESSETLWMDLWKFEKELMLMFGLL